MGDAFRRQLVMDGRFSSVTFVCTKVWQDEKGRRAAANAPPACRASHKQRLATRIPLTSQPMCSLPPPLWPRFAVPQADDLAVREIVDNLGVEEVCARTGRCEGLKVPAPARVGGGGPSAPALHPAVLLAHMARRTCSCT